MDIETTLPRSTYIRLSLLLFFRNKFLYLYLAVCALITAYGLSIGNYGLVGLAWLPYLAYLLLGIVTTLRNSNTEDQPFLLPTRYTFSQTEIVTRTSLGEGRFWWSDFAGWRVLADCYVLFHKEGFILAIPQSSIPTSASGPFRRMLNEKIGNA